MNTTWELHFKSPESSEMRKSFLAELTLKKMKLTELRMDYLHLGDTISVMFSDPDVLMDLLLSFRHLHVVKLTCEFSHPLAPVTGTVVLDHEEDENSKIVFPYKP